MDAGRRRLREPPRPTRRVPRRTPIGRSAPQGDRDPGAHRARCGRVSAKPRSFEMAFPCGVRCKRRVCPRVMQGTRTRWVRRPTGERTARCRRLSTLRAVARRDTGRSSARHGPRTGDARGRAARGTRRTHPSAVLRAGERRHERRAELVDDLTLVREHLGARRRRWASARR